MEEEKNNVEMHTEHIDNIPLEKPKKQRKYVATPARLEAFKKCQEARKQKLESKKSNSIVKPPKQKQITPPQSPISVKSEESSSSEEEYEIKRKPKRSAQNDDLTPRGGSRDHDSGRVDYKMMMEEFKKELETLKNSEVNIKPKPTKVKKSKPKEPKFIKASAKDIHEMRENNDEDKEYFNDVAITPKHKNNKSDGSGKVRVFFY